MKEPIYVRTFAAMGLLASLLRFWACLASKYWQTVWAERLAEFEKNQFPGLQFFAADTVLHRKNGANAA